LRASPGSERRTRRVLPRAETLIDSYVLVNNAAVEREGTVVETTREDWDHVRPASAITGRRDGRMHDGVVQACPERPLSVAR
jgi:hypothetical protein